jgi:rSAM/selenodomain-associated transferase 1
MARHPTPGTVKTRLCPPLTAVEASELYVAFTDDCVAESTSSKWSTHIAVHPPESCDYFKKRYSGLSGTHPQLGSDLGSRMGHAFATLFEEAGPVLMRSSDSPLLSAALIEKAFLTLENDADAVLSYDQGGGYSLVGSRKAVPGLFDMEMSTLSVFDETLRRLLAAELRVEILDPCPDVDIIDDLLKLKDILQEGAALCEKTAAWIRENENHLSRF